ncbi:MAG TPA: hypothetical protein DDW85_03320 [Porphyromonadaceae bacterium]|nr:hypothetical protein [Porphyromonadaceae bacterium]
MRTAQERIYKIYSPLFISKSIDYKGTQIKQSFKEDETGDAAYTPNRRLTPTVILPIIKVFDKDGKFRSGIVNDLLSDIHWYDRDTEIVTGDDYRIETSNAANKGMLTVYKNTPVGTSQKLRFEAFLVDNRRNEIIKITVDDIPLSATASSGDQYSLTLNVPNACYYNPIDNETSLTVNATTFRGDKGTSEVDYELRKVIINTGKATDRSISETDYEIISASGNSFVFDLRMINEESYAIIAKINGKEVARQNFTIKRKYPAWTAKQAGTAEILPGQSEIAKRCIIETSAGLVENPIRFFSIIGFTTSLKKGEMNWGEREELRINTYDAGFVDSGYLGMFFEINEIHALSVGTDEEGNILVDEETGNRILI